MLQDTSVSEEGGLAMLQEESLEQAAWGQALLAVASGEREALRAALLQDGAICSRRLSPLDSATLCSLLPSLTLPPGLTLVEVALECGEEAMVELLLEASPPTPTQPLLRRAISELPSPRLAQLAREHIASHLTTSEPEGLTRLSLPASERQSFFLPRELASLPSSERAAALALLSEAADVTPQIELAVGWWNNFLVRAGSEARQRERKEDGARSLGDANSCAVEQGSEDGGLALGPAVGGVGEGEEDEAWGRYSGLLPIYTSADGNCLLHACLLTSLGLRDRRVARPGVDPGASDPGEAQPRRLLRGALCASLRFEPLRSLLSSHGAQLSKLEERAAAHGCSLEAGHVLALAHVFGRPIIALAPGELEFRDSSMAPTAAAIAGVRLSGLYLPYCIPPRLCASRDPLVICYTRGHFSALVPTEAAAGGHIWRALGLSAPPGPPSVPLPLADEGGAPLPLMFEPRGADVHDAHELVRAIRDYADSLVTTVDGALLGRSEEVSLPLAMMRCPPRVSNLTSEPADTYYNADWKERLSLLRRAA
ncbi:MAG: hypothetical protein SGPRY_013024 [Prymnesium sp.]